MNGLKIEASGFWMTAFLKRGMSEELRLCVDSLDDNPPVYEYIEQGIPST